MRQISAFAIIVIALLFQALVSAEEVAQQSVNSTLYDLRYLGRQDDQYLLTGRSNFRNYLLFAVGASSHYEIKRKVETPVVFECYDDGLLYGKDKDCLHIYNVNGNRIEKHQISGDFTIYEKGIIFATSNDSINVIDKQMNIISSIPLQGVREQNVTFVAPSTIAYVRNGVLIMFDWDSKNTSTIEGIRTIIKYGRYYSIYGKYAQNIRNKHGISSKDCDWVLMLFRDGFELVQKEVTCAIDSTPISSDLNDFTQIYNSQQGTLTILDDKGEVNAHIQPFRNSYFNDYQYVVMIDGAPCMYSQGTNRIEPLQLVGGVQYRLLKPIFVSPATVDGEYVLIYEEGLILWKYRSGEVVYTLDGSDYILGCYAFHQWGETVLVATKNSLNELNIKNRILKRVCNISEKERVAFEQSGSQLAIYECKESRFLWDKNTTYKLCIKVYQIDRIIAEGKDGYEYEVRDKLKRYALWPNIGQVYFLGKSGILFNQARNLCYDRKGELVDVAVAVDSGIQFDGGVTCYAGFVQTARDEIFDMLKGTRQKFDEGSVHAVWCTGNYVFVQDGHLSLFFTDIDKRDTFRRLETSFSDIPARYVLDGSKFICLAYDGKYIGTIDACLSAKQN